MTGRGLDPTGQQHNHLLSIEPEEVVFTSVRLNQVYTQCVRINNPLSCPVDIELVSGNNERVTVNPNSLRLKSQEEMLVEIRLLLRKPVSRMTGRAQDKATDRAYREIIHVKSTHFQQKFFVLFTCWGSIPVISSKPQLSYTKRFKPRIVKSDDTKAAKASDLDSIQICDRCAIQAERLQHLESALTKLNSERPTLEKEIADLKQERDFFVQKSSALDKLQVMLASEEHPVAAMVDVLLEHEREQNEFKNQKILVILENKDMEIERLKGELSSQQSLETQHLHEIDTLQTQLEESLKELKFSKEKLNLAEDSIAMKEYDLANQTQLLEELTKESSSLRSESQMKISSLQSENKILKKKLEDAQTAVSEIESSGSSVNRFEEEIKALHLQITQNTSQHRSELLKAEETIKKLECDLQEHEVLKESNSRMKLKIADFKQKHQKYAQEVESLKREFEKSLGLLSEKDTIIKSLQEEITFEQQRSSEKNVQRLETENAQAKEEIQHLQDTVDQLQKMHSHMQASVLDSEVQFRRRCNKSAADWGDSRSSYVQTRKAIATIFQRLWKQEAPSNDLKSLLSRVHEKLDELDCHIEAARAKNDIHDAEFQTMKLENTRACSLLQCRITSREAEIRYLKLKLSCLHSTKAQDASLQDELIQNLESRCSFLESELNKMNSRESLAPDLIQKLQGHLIKIAALTKKMAERKFRNSHVMVGIEGPIKNCCNDDTEIIRENDTLRLELQSLLSKIASLEQELDLERKFAIQAENLVSDLRDDRCSAQNVEPIADGNQPTSECVICKELEDRLHMAEAQIQRLLEIMPQKLSSVGTAQLEAEISRDERSRFKQLEIELEEAKTHASILIQIIETMQNSESQQTQQQKNALIMTLSAQLSTAKVMECYNERRYRDVSDALSCSQQLNSETRLALQHLENGNFALICELQQCNEQKLLLQEDLRQERILNLKHKRRTESCIIYPRKLKVANSIIESLRKKLNRQRRLFADFSEHKSSQSATNEVAKIDCCSTCKEHISKRINEVTDNVKSLISKFNDADFHQKERCFALMNALMDCIRDCVDSKMESEKKVRVLQQQYKRDNKTISNLQRNLESLQLENEIVTTAMKKLEESFPKNAVKPCKKTCCQRPPENYKSCIALLKSRIQILSQQKNMLQLQRDSEKTEYEAKIACLNQKHEETLAKQVRLEVSLDDPILDHFQQSHEREEEPGLGKDNRVQAQLNAFKTVQSQLMERIDSLVRCNQSLRNSLDNTRQLVKNLEIIVKDNELALIGNLTPAPSVVCIADTAESCGRANSNKITVEKKPSSQINSESVHFKTSSVKVQTDSRSENLDKSVQTNRIPETEVDCAGLMEKVTTLQEQNTKLADQLCAQLSTKNSDTRAPNSVCSLTQVSAVRTLIQHMKTNISHLLMLASNLDLPTVNISIIKQNVKTQALKICSEWRFLEPKICSLCDERSKLAVGVDMLRKQLQELRQMKFNNEKIQSDCNGSFKQPEPERLRKSRGIQVCERPDQRDQISQTLKSLVVHSTVQSDPVSISIVPKNSIGVQTFFDDQTQLSAQAVPVRSGNNVMQLTLCEKEVQADESSRSSSWRKKFKLTKAKLNDARAQIDSMGQQINQLQAQSVQAQQAFSEEKKKMQLNLKEKYELKHQRNLDEATVSLKENIAQLNLHLKEEISLHTAQFEALLKEFERYRHEHQHVVEKYESKLAEVAKEKSVTRGLVQLVDPNGDLSPRTDRTTDCSECHHLKSVQKDLERVREQLSAANATCRELRHDLHRSINENLLHQENASSFDRSRSPSAADGEHERAIAKLENKLQQCRAQIKSLATAANVSASSVKEINELKPKLENMRQSLDDKDKRIKSLQSSIVHRDKIIEDLNARIRSASGADRETKESIRSLQDKLSRSNVNLATKQAFIKELQEKLERLEMQCDKKESQLESLRHCKSALQRKESAMNGIQTELGSSVKRCKDLEQSITELQRNVAECQKTICLLEKNIKQSKEENNNLKESLRAVGEYLLCCISRLKEELILLSNKTDAIGHFSQELNVDPSILTKTLPEFTLLDLHELLGPPQEVGYAPEDHEIKISQLIRDLQDNPRTIKTLKEWIDEKAQLEQKRISTPG